MASGLPHRLASNQDNTIVIRKVLRGRLQTLADHAVARELPRRRLCFPSIPQYFVAMQLDRHCPSRAFSLDHAGHQHNPSPRGELKPAMPKFGHPGIDLSCIIFFPFGSPMRVLDIGSRTPVAP